MLLNVVLLIFSFVFVATLSQSHAQNRTSAADILVTVDGRTDERFCAGDAEVYTQTSLLRVRYVNRSKMGYDIRVGGLNALVETLISKSIDGLRRKQYEAEWESYNIPSGREDPPKSIHLEPGQSTLSDIPLSLIVSSGPTRIPNTLVAGTYYLQIGVRFGVIRNSGQPDEFRVVQTPPIRIVVPKSPVLKDCSNN